MKQHLHSSERKGKTEKVNKKEKIEDFFQTKTDIINYQQTCITRNESLHVEKRTGKKMLPNGYLYLQKGMKRARNDTYGGKYKIC